MRNVCTISLVIATFLFAVTSSPAAADPRVESLRAADDERVAAIIAADRERLTAIFSDDLRYAHSTGTTDDKASYVDLLVTCRAKYLIYDYQERHFTFPSPDIALVSGRVHIKSASATGVSDGVLIFLSVWRKEKGHWRFLAWQSCKLPQTTPTAK